MFVKKVRTGSMSACAENTVAVSIIMLKKFVHYKKTRMY